MRCTRQTPSLLLGVLIAAVVVGCGGDDSGGAGAKVGWVEQANRICDDAQKKSADLPDDLGLGADAEARRTEREIVQARLEGLRDLQPPADVAGQLERMIELEQRSRRAFDEFQAAAKAAGSGEADQREKSVRLLGEQKRLGEQAGAIARKIGLTACAGA
jgi:hypothetical protein